MRYEEICIELFIFNLMSCTATRIIVTRSVSAFRNDEGVVVNVNFVDYMTGKPTSFCRGTFGLGLSKNSDMEGVIRMVVKQIKKLFSKY